MRAEELSLRATVPPAQVPGYKLDRLLGQGAFGQVWVGTNLNTGRTVAVKFYLHRAGVNWSLLTREVKNLVSMAGNRLIVQVLEVGWDAEPPYYVMEYLENGSLDDLIRKRGALPISQAISLFTDIARGLNHSHGKGVLHCDLKPANVLLDPELQPRLADFGQSRLSNEQTPSLGTLFYMAPEQADLNAVPDARWDVYALGAILYCMLVGSPPYRTPDTVTTLDTAGSLPERLKRYRDTIHKSPFPRLHHRVQGMDRMLVGIIDRCLAKKPEDRFENVQQVLESIERRQIARLNLPMMMLGIVGPVLLLLVMGLFFWRGVAVAERESANELKEMVLQNNLFAARLGARTLEKEIETLFRLIEEEAKQPQLEKLFSETIHAAGSDLLESLIEDGVTDTERLPLLELQKRQELEKYLLSRFNRIQANSGSKRKTAEFDSLFLTDRWGTMIAAAFSGETSATRIGYNFAYRSYFNGQSQDSDESISARKFQGTQSSHISVPFRSTSTNRWKIAVSTPISIAIPTETEKEEPSKTITGVLVLTINLGDFDLLPDESSDGMSGSRRKSDRLAVMVDGHAGTGFQKETREGTILQHPAFSQFAEEYANAPNIKYQIDDGMLSRLKGDGTYQYIDPVSIDDAGQEYAGQWIAAMAKVEISRKTVDSIERKEPANLWVLVQARADTVTSPVASMGEKMMREGFIALLTLLAMVCSLWMFVVWVMRLPDSFRAVIQSRNGGGTELTGAANEVTLDADR
ncbi:Serine/threonine-protein kinase PknB [Pirellula sp. SH-Sr6A]|uniref:serine/threonine protein kinase n=1 Tax=Pirellula sp. SH-Sr6A TaxID=1632865 RepID=UPI00078EA6BB|nr:serine/threonine protein kinase [Pirellula sp. SH-Sr6A]AMV32247.1 Serine/threonine-protein kinase PknB [Pirellula sp. SH-Sr6A]